MTIAYPVRRTRLACLASFSVALAACQSTAPSPAAPPPGPVLAVGTLGHDGTDQQILSVAPSEAAVAVARDAHGGIDCPAAFGSLVVFYSDSAGHTNQRQVSTQVAEATFSSDSRYLVYIDHEPTGCFAQSGDLEIAFADGSNPRLVASAVMRFELVGGTVFYSTASASFTAPLDGGAPVTVPDSAMINATGTAEVAQDGAGNLTLVDTATGKATALLDANQESLLSQEDLLFAPGGAKLAWVHGQSGGVQTLSLIDSDGTHRVDLSHCTCESIVYSPSGDRLAYEVASASGSGEDMIVHSLTGGADVRLSGLPSGVMPSRVSFTADGSHLLYVYAPSGIDAGQILLSSSASSGSFITLTSDLDLVPTMAPSGRGDFIAIGTYGSGVPPVGVLPLGGGPLKMLPEGSLWIGGGGYWGGGYPAGGYNDLGYEPSGAHVLLTKVTNWPTSDDAFDLYAADGTGTPIQVPGGGNVLNALWFGGSGSVLYVTLPVAGDSTLILGTFRDDGTGQATLATGTDFAAAGIAVPTRIFYLDTSSNLSAVAAPSGT
jgi:hypothetical protein